MSIGWLKKIRVAEGRGKRLGMELKTARRRGKWPMSSDKSVQPTPKPLRGSGSLRALHRGATELRRYRLRWAGGPGQLRLVVSVDVTEAP